MSDCSNGSASNPCGGGWGPGGWQGGPIEAGPGLHILASASGFSYINGKLEPPFQTITFEARISGIISDVNWSADPNGFKQETNSSTFSLSTQEAGLRRFISITATAPNGEARTIYLNAQADPFATIGAPMGTYVGTKLVEEIIGDIEDTKERVLQMIETMGSMQTAQMLKAELELMTAVIGAAKEAAEEAVLLTDIARDDAIAEAQRATNSANVALSYTNQLVTIIEALEGVDGEALSSIVEQAGIAAQAANDAQAAATASVGAAQVASAQASDAEQSATASEAAKTAAETAKSLAQASASNAATSADTASGSAAAAQSSAGLAVQSKNAAENAASASSQSAANAATSASDAGQAASVANSSKLAAETANTQAGVKRNEAVVAASNAAESAAAAYASSLVTASIGEDLDARVETNAGAIANIEGSAAFLEQRVAASDSTPAVMMMKAGKNGSAVGLLADKIALGNSVNGQAVDALVLENGNAYFNGMLRAGSVRVANMSRGLGSNMLLGAIPGANPERYMLPGWNPDGVVYSTNGNTIFGSRNFYPMLGAEWSLDDNSTVWVQQNNDQSGGVGLSDFYFAYVPTPNGTKSPYHPIEKNKTYELSVYSGAHRCRVYAVLVFYDENFVHVEGHYSNTNDNELLGGRHLNQYKRLVVRQKAPNSARYALVGIRKEHTKPGNSDSWLMFTRPMLAETTEGATEDLSYSYPASGFLHAESILANSIDTNQLKANAVTAEKLSTGLLITSSAQIGDAVINNAKIANLSVDTIKIVNGAVTSAATVAANNQIINNTQNWVELANLTFTTTGSNIIAIANVDLLYQLWNDTQFNESLVVAIKLGHNNYAISSVGREYTVYTNSFYVNPMNPTISGTIGGIEAGTHQFVLLWRRVNAHQGNTIINGRSLFLLETKR